MFLPILSSQNQLMKVAYINELLALNEEIKDRGLKLTEEDAKHVIDARSQTLKKYERVELGINVTKNIIELFSSSPSIDEKNYLHVITAVQEMFYYYKNETFEKVGDEKLLKIIYNYFNKECRGSIRLLKGIMEEYSKKVRMDQMNKEYMDEGRDIYERRHK